MKAFSMIKFYLSWTIFHKEMFRDPDAEPFAKTAGIPVGLSRIFANTQCARDRCRSSEKSLGSSSI